MSLKSTVNACLEAISRLPEDRTLNIAIDGRCGSGKSTLAAALAEQLGAPVVHMDDFYVPHAQKTAQRLSQPGGNADMERFALEVLEPRKRGERVVYRPYDCGADCLREAIIIPADARIMIVEGSYSLHPAMDMAWDLRVFLTISEAEQAQRIRARNGESRWLMFRDRWIPLEEAYFKAFGLPDEGCLTLDTTGAEP